MRSVLSLFAALLLAAPALAQPKLPNLPPNLMAPTDPLSPEDERKQFKVPDGFQVQLVASEPDIQKPMQMAFDAKGRLWVTTSYHYPFAAKEKPTDKVFVLSDFDPETGKAKKVQTFTSDLNIPIGILPMPDGKSVIVSSVGEIRKYKIADGEGGPKSDGFEVLFKGFGSRDTHGMYNSYTLMPDGWVYACHGFANDSTVKDKSGNEIKMQSGHTFRFKPDGSKIEVWTRGQVNPFGMTVDPWFNLYTADCHSKPITQLIPGAYYDSFGKPHDGLGFAPHVTAHPHKSTGLCGLSWYDANQFPAEYKGTMFLGDVVSNCISHDKIDWKGASPVAKEMPDFLTSKDRWFRPVDIKLGPDGALYVADFYNKIIGHYEVDLKDPRRDKDRGRLWRIVWKGKDGKAAAPKFHRADFTTATDAELFDDLIHPNLAVRFTAGHQLRRRVADGKQLDSEGVLARVTKNIDRAESVLAWLMFIYEAGKDRPVVNDYQSIFNAATDPKYAVKPEHLTGQLVRALASRTKWNEGEREVLLYVLKTFDSVHQRRACVEAMAAHPHATFAKPLVAILKGCPADDTHLKQAAKVALRNCLAPEDAVTRREFGDLIGADEKTDLILIESLLGVRTELGANNLVYVMGNSKADFPAALLPGLAEHIGRYAHAVDVRIFLDKRPLTGDKVERNADLHLAVFRGMQARGDKLSANQIEQRLKPVADLLASIPKDEKGVSAADAKRIQSALRLVPAIQPLADARVWQQAKLADLSADLSRLLKLESAPIDLRAASAEAQLIVAPKTGYDEFRALLGDPKTTLDLRARLLIGASQSSNHNLRLDARDGLKDVPYRVAVPIATNLAGTNGGADILLTAVKEGKAPQRLLQEKAILERLKASNAPDWEKRVAELTKNLPPADQRIAALLKTRADGFAKAKPDKVEGAKLFTKHCAACHKIGDQGGKIAPQLDGVGVRGVERLLEDVLDPNRNVDQAFRARSITLKSEKTLTALMLRVEGKVLVVADLEGKEQRIPLDDIETNRETLLSAMPANFDTVIPEADLYHIVAYLLDQKAKEPPKKE